MDYFGQFQTDFVQLWSNVGHIWPFLDRKFALRLFQNTETAFRACFFVMEITFSMEKFPHSAVGFRSKDQAASRARIFSWSALQDPLMSRHDPPGASSTVHDLLGKSRTHQYLASAFVNPIKLS